MSETAPQDQSTARYRALFNFIGEAIFVVNGKTGMIVDANPAAETLTGRSLSEIRELHHGELHPSDQAEAARQALTEFVRNPPAFRAKEVVKEWEVLHRDGRSIPVDILAETFAGPDGTPLVFSIFHDASARKNAEQSLRDSELKYRRLHESIRDAVVAIDMAGHIQECNPAFEAMVGYTAEELRQMTYRDLTPERWHKSEARMLAEQVLTVDHSEVYEKEYRRRDGIVFPVELRTFLLRDEGGQPTGMWAIVRDITQRKHAEKELRESERRFRSLFDNGFDAVLLTNKGGTIQAANPAACAMFGMTEEEICSAGLAGLIVCDSRLSAALETRRSTGRAQSQLTFMRKDGSSREGAVASMVLDEHGQAFVIMRDITERIRSEQALRRSEEQFSTLFRSSPISITVSDLSDSDRFLEVNEAFEKFTGHPRESVIGKTYPPDWLWADADEYAQAVAQFASSGQLNGAEFRFRRTTGEIRNGQLWARVIDFAGKPCVVAMTIDVTERTRAEADRERLQQQLAHAQKMECVGRLAGGIAHDFNNLMSVILLYADSAAGELNGADPAKESITAIQDAAQKAVVLGRQLMAFSQKQVPQTELLDLNSVIAENQKMIRRLIGEDVKVVFNPRPAALVKADRGQLGQIIVNLAVNARDAMPQGGTFEIQTCHTGVEEGVHQPNPAASPGSYAVLKVRDDGTGMDAETQSRAFEPFFTTKGVGKGTGLGLSVVYALVNQMGGFIDVASEPGKGTEFRINLPVACEAPERILEAEEGPILGGTETILLSEDEPALREKVHQVLAKAGYRVIVAADGVQALQSSNEETAPIHLLVTDIVMPEMSGYRLAERLLSLRPRIKVLYMSGYPHAGDESITLPPEPNFIQKPFTKEKLLRRVRELLDSSGSQA